MDSDRDDGGCDQSPAVQTKGRQQADKRQTGPKIQTKFRQKADKAKILGKMCKKVQDRLATNGLARWPKDAGGGNGRGRGRGATTLEVA